MLLSKLFGIKIYKDVISFYFTSTGSNYTLDALIQRHILWHSLDLAPECHNPHDTRYYPERILLYDQHPGGMGVSMQVRAMNLKIEKNF